MVLGTVGTVYCGLRWMRPQHPGIRPARIMQLDPRRNPEDREIIDSGKLPGQPEAPRGPSLPVRRGLIVSVALLVAGLGVSFFGATREHLHPILQARREGLPAPRQEVLKSLHNLAMALAMMVGVAGATGLVLSEGARSPYRDLRIGSIVVLLASVAIPKGLQRWTPFEQAPRRGFRTRRPPTP